MKSRIVAAWLARRGRSGHGGSAGQGYLVARIDKVLPADLPADQLDAMRTQFAQVLAQAESQAYLQALKNRFGAATLANAAAMAASAASR